MELHHYARILMKRWWLILLLTIVGAGSAVYYSSGQPPIYRSTVTLLLSPALGNDLLPYYLSERTRQLAETYTHYMKTRTFAERVIEREGLDVSAEQFVGAVVAQVVGETQFFEITATANAPEPAQKLAMGIANSFIEENLAQQQRELASKRSASDVDNAQALLQEKLEREQNYYEGLVAELRKQVTQIQTQPASAARDELLAQMQEQLSEYEAGLLQIMSDRVSLQPKLDEGQINSVSIAEPAALPSQPVNTRNTQNVLFGALAGLLLGVTLAFGLEYLDFTLKSPAELEELLGQPPLGLLGITSTDKAKGDGYRIVVLEEPRSPTAEAFRSLRTNLQYSQVGHDLRSLVVTSSSPGEGKTTTVANLAVTFAYSGRNVIVVDADMRKPNQHRIFNLRSNPGLTDLILAENPTDPEVLHQHLQNGPLGNLRVLTCGNIPSHPSELLGSEWVSNIFSAILADADLVIFDTPPALTVTDAVILASRADATLLVVQAGVARKDMVLKTKAMLERVGANVLPPVLNRVKTRDVGYYQYYYSSKYEYGEQ